MILFLLQQALRDQHGHGHVLMSVPFEHSVQNLLDILPDGVAIGAHDEAALDAGVIHQLCLGANIGEPLGKVHFHIGDLFHFLFFCHCISSLSPEPLLRRIRGWPQFIILPFPLFLVNSDADAFPPCIFPHKGQQNSVLLLNSAVLRQKSPDFS